MSKTESDGAATAAAAPTGLSTGNADVDQIGTMHFEGNLIDHRWLVAKELKFKNGKLNLNAVMLLADIVYWYRPTVERDEQTNAIKSVRKKFQYDKLYKDYEMWGASLGLTKRQVQDAVLFLHKTGIITRTVGRIKYPDGARSNSLPFIALNPERLAQITYSNALPEIARRKSPHVVTEGTPRQNGTPPAPKRETRTETTTKTSASTNTVEAPRIRSYEDDEIEAALIANGVNPPDAKRMSEQFPEEMKWRLELLPFGNAVRSPAAWLTGNPNKHYNPSPAYKRAKGELAESAKAAIKKDAEYSESEEDALTRGKRIAAEKSAKLRAQEEKELAERYAQRSREIPDEEFNEDEYD